MKNAVRCFLVSLACLTGSVRAEETNVEKDLRDYYQHTNGFSHMVEALKNLESNDLQARDAAETYVIAVLKQTQVDEVNGAGRRALPYFGSSGENLAQHVRKAVARQVSIKSITPATRSVIRWFLDHEKDPDLQAMLLPAFEKMGGPDAGEFCLSLVRPPHENSAVVVASLKQIDRHKLPIPDAALASLCQHHRKSIREAARNVHRERGGADPGPFDPVAAMQSPPIVKMMDNISGLLYRPVSTDAESVMVTTEHKYEGKSSTSTTFGWLVKDDGNRWEIVRPYGDKQSFEGDQRNGWMLVGSSSSTTKQKYDIAKEVERIAKLRAEGDREMTISVDKRPNVRERVIRADVYETRLAHWLYSAKQFDLAGQILMPALETVLADRELVDVIRHHESLDVGYMMLVAFAGDRDFREAERLAQWILERYPETYFHDLAGKFVKELPRRREDFKTLTLPTPEAWARLKNELSRAEQIAYLAQRIRLLNCFQCGQPGGYSISETQSAEARGMSSSAAWPNRSGETKVINPYLELAGETQFAPDDKQSIQPGMGLKLADIPQLAEFLRDDSHMLCVSFWRDFHPSRTVGTTRDLFCQIIDNIAKKKLCKAVAMTHMSDEEIEKEIQRIQQWAKDNADKSTQQLIWETLDEEVKAGTRVYDLSDFRPLIGLKDQRLVAVLTRMLEQAKNEYEARDILEFCLQFDAIAFKEVARNYISNKRPGVRIIAARILFAGGEINEGRELLASILEHDDLGPQAVSPLDVIAAIDVLLKEGSDVSKQAARKVFKNKHYAKFQGDRIGDVSRASLVNRFAKAAIPDGYLSYLPLLDIRGNRIGNSTYGADVVVGELIANEIIDDLAPDDSEIRRIKQTFPKPADQIVPLKKWLKTKAAAMAQ